MGFNVEFRNKDGVVLDWPQLDKEVWELWGVEPDNDHWATPPCVTTGTSFSAEP